MPTIGDTITAALQDLGVVGAGETPSPEDSALALARLNDWLDGLQHEHLTIPYVARTTWTLTTASSYTIGSGATISVTRPQSRSAIQNIGYIRTDQDPDAEYLLELFTDEVFAGISQKGQTNSLPLGFYYRATDTTGTIIPWPVPDGTATLQGVIYTLAVLSEFTSLTQDFAPARGYRRFFRTNLAVELAPAFERAQIPPALLAAAAESKANVKMSNYRPLEMRCDPAVAAVGVGRWNLEIDGHNR